MGANVDSMVLRSDITPRLLMDGPVDGAPLTSTDVLGFTNAKIVTHADGQISPYPPEFIQRLHEHLDAKKDTVFRGGDQALLLDN